MEQTQIISIMQDAIFTTIAISAPMLIVAVLAGLIISVFQATTQINEPTLAFVPKIVAVLLAILIFAGFMMNMGIEFTQRLFESILSYIG